MSFRKEIKSILSNNKIFDLNRWILENGGRLLYPKRIVNSLYFDNWNFSMYSDSVEGVLPRKKIRLRHYNRKSIQENDFQNINKEMKISSAEGRFKLSSSAIDSKELILRGFYDKDYGVCYPVTNIIYERVYYKIKNIRLTIDSNISYRQASKNGASVFTTKDNFSVVEIKYNNDMNNNFIIRNFPFQFSRFSKYCRAVEFTNKNYCNEIY